jgi:hypothetical protein
MILHKKQRADMHARNLYPGKGGYVGQFFQVGSAKRLESIRPCRLLEPIVWSAALQPLMLACKARQRQLSIFGSKAI